MLAPADAVQTYILAKDGNRPFLMSRAFADGAELQIVLKTAAIAFPSETKGRQPIEDILMRRFNVDHENVFTFCLCEPPRGQKGASSLSLAGRHVGQGGRPASRRLRALRRAL